MVINLIKLNQKKNLTPKPLPPLPSPLLLLRGKRNNFFSWKGSKIQSSSPTLERGLERGQIVSHPTENEYNTPYPLTPLPASVGTIYRCKNKNNSKIGAMEITEPAAIKRQSKENVPARLATPKGSV